MIQRDLETAIDLLEKNQQPCGIEPQPIYYYNWPEKYCSTLEQYCPYQKERGKDYICTYYETISLMFGKYLKENDNSEKK